MLNGPQPAAESTDAGRTPRTYRSPLREKQAAATRAALLDAAHRLFLSKGWFGTGMRDVAREAGVATETLYGHFSSKRVLFREVVDTAFAGDAAPDAIAGRPEFAPLEHGTHGERVASAARVFSAAHERASALAKVLREAAATDDQLAQVLHATRERQREDVAKAVEFIIGREPSVGERDGVWAVTSAEVYVLLVENSGWRTDQYESWITETLERILPAQRSRARKRR